MRASWIAVSAIVGACSPAPGPDAGLSEEDPPEGPTEGELAADVLTMCGDATARLVFHADAGTCSMIGTCALRTALALEVFNARKITSASGHLTFAFTDPAELVVEASVPLLQASDELELASSVRLERIEFESLAELERFDVQGNDELDTLEMPLLRSITDHFAASSNPKLPVCDLIALADQLTTAPETISINPDTNCSSCCP